MNIKPIVFLIVVFALYSGCAEDSKQVKGVRKLTKPVDDTAENLLKVREVKNEEGEARAIVSPADERQLKFTF